MRDGPRGFEIVRFRWQPTIQLLVVSLLAVTLSAGAVQAAGAVRVIVLWTARGAAYQRLYGAPDRAFVDELGRNGFSTRNGLALEEHSLDEVPAADQVRLVKRLVASRPDLIFTLGTDAARLVAAATAAGTPDVTGSVSMLYAMVFQPPPGDHPNAAGVLLSIPPSEQFDALHSADPSARRIGVVYNPRSPLSASLIDEARRAATAAGLSLDARPAATPDDVPGALEEFRGKVDIVWMVPDASSANPGVVAWCKSNNVPLMGLSDSYVDEGALLALFPDYTDVGRQAAGLAVKILRGALPSSLAVRPPRRALLYINLATAQKLKIHIPDAVRETADRLV
ncbi:MAG: ABC transporter substrate-binding protein, partial [Chloroflexi bacterium]|nr:ABC transporter substrate-binding protein [Chloroflexota bacterium]